MDVSIRSELFPRVLHTERSFSLILRFNECLMRIPNDDARANPMRLTIEFIVRSSGAFQSICLRIMQQGVGPQTDACRCHRARDCGFQHFNFQPATWPSWNLIDVQYRRPTASMYVGSAISRDRRIHRPCSWLRVSHLLNGIRCCCFLSFTRE